MCRMLAFKSKEVTEAAWIFQLFESMSREGMGAPHGDGFGFTLLRSDERISYNCPRAIWNTEPSITQAKLAILHSRKVSPGYVVNPNHVHPFYGQLRGKPYAFCHNGTIHDFANGSDTIDTQRYFQLLLNNLESREPQKALDQTAKFVAAHYKYTSLNALLTDYESIWAIRLNAKNNDSEHSLYLYEEADIKLLASEPIEKFANLPGKSTEIKNGELITL